MIMPEMFMVFTVYQCRSTNTYIHLLIKETNGIQCIGYRLLIDQCMLLQTYN